MPDIEEFYGQPNMNDTKLNASKTELARASVTITQEADSCSDEVQVLTLSADDAGGGWFWVIETERWAFDSLDELKDQLRGVMSKLEELKDEVESNESIKTKK